MFIRLLSVCNNSKSGESLAFNSKVRIKCVSLNNRPCEARPTIVKINCCETLFYPFIVSVI